MALSDSKIVKRIDKITAELKSSTSEEERLAKVSSYLEALENEVGPKTPEFDEDLEWLNCKNPLSFKNQLKGKICVLDFFTYCCINCMHILPDLEALENEHSEIDGVVIVGVHSAKFDNEKSSANILSAVIRYDIHHAVVNDAEAKMWHTLGVACWPTLVIVGPSGKILLSLVGEGHRQTLLHFIGATLKYYKGKGKISDHPIGVSLAKDDMPKKSLSFPGKMCIDHVGRRLVVADTGHHRILVMSVEGVVHHVIGGGERFQSGFKDGNFSESRFHSPQGVAIRNETIYVADTENHAIRKLFSFGKAQHDDIICTPYSDGVLSGNQSAQIDLEDGTLTTVAGTGHQGNDKEGGSIGKEQPISSPWDVIIGPAPGSKMEESNHDALYIAMAGTHQIWVLYLEDGPWLKGSSQKAGTCIRFAGSGDEANRNNSYPHKAAFAQPSGLALAFIKSSWSLFVADSESSSIRVVDIATGATKAVVGADRDPNNLFAFGDVDGKGVDVKLQHPLGVAWNSCSQELYVADSYNHKIKKINPADKTCTTYLGNGKPSPNLLDEPGGLCVSPDGQQLYVADTNNSCVRVIDLNSSQVTKITVIDQESHSSSFKKPREQTDSGHVTQHAIKRITSTRIPVTQHPPVSVTTLKDIEVKLNIVLPSGCSLTEEAPSRWQVCWLNTDSQGDSTNQKSFSPSSGVLTTDSLCAVSIVTWPDVSASQDTALTMQMEALVYYCEPSGTCRMEALVYHVPFVASKDEPAHNTVVLNHTLKI